MAEEINLIVNVEGDGKRTVKEVRDELKGAEEQAKQTGQAIGDGVEKAGGKTKSLKAELRELKQTLLTLDEGSKEFQTMSIRAAQLTDQIGDVNARVKALASDTKRIDALVGVGTGIAAGFQAASGAMALFGSDSKKVEESIKNVIAVQGILNGVQQVAQLLQKEHIVGIYLRMGAEKVATGATIAWTAAQRVLNLVMTANPIGLLIAGIAALATGIGFLIANIDSVIGWFGKLFQAMLFLESEEDAIEANRARRAQENAKRNTQRLKELDDERKARKEQFNEEQEVLDLEISALEAVGKSSYALRLQKAQNRNEDLKAELAHIGKVSESWTQYYEDQAVLSGKTREEFIATLKGQGIDIEKLTAQRNELQKDVEQEIKRSEIEISKIKYDEGVKQSTEAKKQSDERIKIAQAEADALKRALEEKAKAEAEADALFLQRQQDLFDAEFDAMEAQIDLENQQKLDADAFDEELAQKKKDRINGLAQGAMDSAQNTINFLESINTLANGRDIARIKAKQERGEKLTANELKRLENQAKIEKALAVGQIIVDGAKGIAGAISAGAAVPYPGNIIAIASGIASVVASTAVALAKVGASDSTSVPGLTADSLTESANEVGATEPNVRDLTGSTLLNSEQKIFVVESDITNTQNTVKGIVNQATYG